VVLVDTPWFDDAQKTDMEILTMIGDWLRLTYQKNVRLAGILYLHRISDNRMSGSPHKNLHMFGKLCGDTAAQSVILVSTMWDRVGESMAESRETQLIGTYWKGMLDNHAKTARFHNSLDSAWGIIDQVAE
ncbi:hypothetical protein JAAARDRAFT_92711, partial [Jaapia argillacea MUCL 33604]